MEKPKSVIAIDPQMPRKWAASAWYLLAIIATAANVISAMLVLSGAGKFRAGERNDDLPFILTHEETLWVLIWLISMGVLAATCIWASISARQFGLGSLLVCLVVIFVQPNMTPNGFERYQSGFVQWALNIDVDAIRKWDATLTPVNVETVIPMAQWPPAIAQSYSASVMQQPYDQGIVIQWGILAAWGTSRKIFVGAREDSPNPQDIHHLWNGVRIGVYAGIQDRG